MIDEPEDSPKTRPDREAERLAALAAYGILDTPPEQAFDDIVLLARALCRAPVALVSLVDRDRQWFKARSGFEPCQTPLEQSVCSHALGQTDLLIIPDLTLDARTRANTLVTGEPFLRFYAGAPLVTPAGEVLGTLCVLDHVPRADGLTEAEGEALSALSRQVVTQLELRLALADRDRALLEKREGDRHHRMILDSAVDHAIFSLDASGRVTAWSRGAEALLGWREEEMLGVSVERLFSAEDQAIGLLEGDLGQARAEGRALGEGWRPRKDGSRFLASSETRPLVSETGAPIGWLVILRDLTIERRREHRLTILAEASAALLSASGAGDVLKPILEEGAELIGFDQCCMFDIAADGCHLHLTHGIGLDPQTQERLGRTAMEWPLCGIVAETAEPVVLSGLLESAEPRHAIAHAMRFDGYAGFPILSQGRAKGVISFTRVGPGAFDGETIAFFATIARFMSATRERLDAEEGLRASERKWRELFEELQESFVLGRLVRDAEGRVVDWRYEAVNRAWSGLTGVSSEEAVGRTVRELFPDLGKEWVRGVATAVAKRKPIRFLRTVEPMRRSFEGVVQPTGADGFSALFMEVTDRAKADARRDALATLGERLLRGDEEASMLRDVAKAVGEALQATGVAYRSVMPDGHLSSAVASWRADGARPEEPLDGEELARLRPLLAKGRVVTRGRRADGVSHADRDASRPATIHQPVLEGGQLVALLQVTADTPRRWSAEEIGFVAEAATRIRAAVERRRMETLLRDNERRLLTLVQALPVGVLLAEARTGRVIAGNRRMDAILGRPAESVLAPGGDAQFLAFDGEGQPISASACPLPRILKGEAERATLEMHLERPDGSRIWIEVVGEAIRDVTGRLRGAVLCASEIEDRKRAEAHQRILARELSHRLKNTLAVVQSIATQTLRSTTDIETARGTLSQRIQALSHAHEILLTGQHDAGSVEAIVAGAVRVHDTGGRVALTGPQVLIGPRAALALALIANELSTNAVKYGALSVPDGRIAVDWSLRREAPGGPQLLDFRWIETGGPPVVAPSRKGFGTRLVGMGLTGTPEGAVDLTYDPAGLTCRIVAPLNDLVLDKET
ncbi:GAF domain-containing protein [Aureimonas ureilytica]|uniref:GAF domain-containing protein n=1 Tax=Aureimonas ureilytica TaxID=401562 RepID=UPI003CF90D8B